MPHKRETMGQELHRLLQGCSACSYDEADGGIVNHCDSCCRRVATWAWQHQHDIARMAPTVQVLREPPMTKGQVR